MLFARGHRRNDTPPIRCPLFSRTGHSALKCREFQITRREKKPNGHQKDGEHGGNGGGGRNGGGGGNSRCDESGAVGGNRGGRGSKNRSGTGGKQKKSSKDSKSGDKTACSDCYFCPEPHKASECPNRYAFAMVPATPNSQHGVFLGSVRTNRGAGLLVVTSARPALAARGAPRERHEDEYWVADSDATENMIQDSSLLQDYTPAPSGDEVESAGGVIFYVVGCGRLRLLVNQDNGTFKGATRELTLDRVAHIPKQGRYNLLSTKRLTTAFDAPMRVYLAAATIRPRFSRETLVFRSLLPEPGLLETKAHLRADMEEPPTPLTTARSMVTARANPCHIMEFYRLFGHPSEEIPRGTALMSGVPLTGTWRSCVQCSESRVRRYAVPKSTESHAIERVERFFINITGLSYAASLGGNRYAMLCVDGFTRFKFIRSLKHKSDAAKELRELVAEHIAPSGINIGTVRTDGGGEFEGDFQSHLKELGIKRETTPPHTPQHYGVAERALGLLRDKTVALLRGMIAGKSDRLWTEAMNDACEMSKRFTTTSLNPGVFPYELWVGHRLTFDHLISFGTVGYLRRSKHEHKLAPRGVNCIMLGIDTNYPRRTFRVRDLTTDEVVMLQAIIWDLTADVGEAVSSDTATRGGGRDTDNICRDSRKLPTARPH